MKSRRADSILDSVERGLPLLPGEAKSLLDVASSTGEYERIIALSQEAKARIFAGEVYPIVPLYVSSICQEHCLYCNFRVENGHDEIQRLRLSDEELKQEVRFLAERGLRVVELVYAADPLITAVDIARHIRITAKILSEYGGGVVGMNARPLSVENYGELKRSGLGFAVLWLETYNKTVYALAHPGNTEKADFDYRFTAYERMVQAEIVNIGFGVLSGLSNWREDWYALICHVDNLLTRYAGVFESVILGVPRLKAAVGAALTVPSAGPTDAEYLLAIAVFNLCFPTALPFVSTREDWDLCVKTARGGGTLFTLNCKTIPGGYSLGRSGYQFPTYNFDSVEYSFKLAGEGLIPVFDWDFDRIKNLGTRKEGSK